jgi:hypothetical protein
MVPNETWAKGEAVRRIFLTLLLVLAGLSGCMAPPEAVPPEAIAPAARDSLMPIVRGTDDVMEKPPATLAAAPPAAPQKPAAPVRVDEKARTVRIPARFTGARGVVEWLLAAGGKHPVTSIFVTDASVRDIAAALARTGLAAGSRPQPAGEDRARPPAGHPVEINVMVRDAGGPETRIPAARFLSRRSGGDPLGDGAWIYVGPQVIREGDANILVTEFSGSVATTDLRDSSAMIYWVPGPGGDTALYFSAYYASNVPISAGTACEIEVRPSASPGAVTGPQP